MWSRKRKKIQPSLADKYQKKSIIFFSHGGFGPMRLFCRVADLAACRQLSTIPVDNACIRVRKLCGKLESTRPASKLARNPSFGKLCFISIS